MKCDECGNDDANLLEDGQTQLCPKCEYEDFDAMMTAHREMMADQAAGIIRKVKA